ncbi:hypothetical protein [uncultured Mediterranean phage uvDeep-CGR2-KM19-C269]|nr:hypothetical protein [uncultured Mediterranean phage uvDeep-CGR2-KM19-C269]
MRGKDGYGNWGELKPTPLTDKQLADLKIQHEKERQERLALLDNTEVQARLYYYKGVRQATTLTQEHLVTNHHHKPLFTADLDLDAYGQAVVIGTERQRCADDTFDKITGIYTLNLTERMIKAYEEGGKKLLISKQF